jgi:3-hydroxybenzoate 6-monooxygenase
MSATGRTPLLIVGGGIGGLAAALAAANAGRPVHVIEKAHEFGEIGAGLQLAPNAMRMMDRLGILSEISKHAMFPKKMVLMDAWSGEHVWSADLGRKFQEHYGYPYIVMHRGDLLAVQLEACRANKLISLESNREAIQIEDFGDFIRVKCADGSVYECDAAVGADGIWSNTRKAVYDDGEPICAQSVAYRGTIPIEEVPKSVNLENMTVWVGPDVHFVTYVVHHGKLLNIVAVFKSARYKEGSDDWGAEDELEEHFSVMCAHVREGVTKVRRDRRWAMYDRLPIPNWTRNKITLLGDAAHPMLQYAAQGACQALEDAVCLGDCLKNDSTNTARAFQAYQGRRIKRTARVQNIARFMEEFYHMRGAARIMRNELFTKIAGDDYTYLDELYTYAG